MLKYNFNSITTTGNIDNGIWNSVPDIGLESHRVELYGPCVKFDSVRYN